MLISGERLMGKSRDAQEYLCSIYGSQKESTVYRWLRLAEAITSDEVVGKLRTMPYLKQAYLMSNNFFVGVGAHVRDKLMDIYAVAALDVLVDDSVDGEIGITSVQFMDIAKSFKILELWEKMLIRRFGSVARDSLAAQRVVKSLRTRAGWRKISACSTVGVPLHGKGPENPGILECHALVVELEKCKAGGLAPPDCFNVQQALKDEKNLIAVALAAGICCESNVYIMNERAPLISLLLIIYPL